jgi:hypothetical protein
MTLETCTAILAPLALAFRAEVDVPTFTVYARALADVPPPLLQAATNRALRTRRFFPTVAELLEDAEACRLALAAGVPFVPCVACRDRWPGWMTIVDPAGEAREDRCACWRAHQARLARLGVPAQPVWVALQAGTETEDGAA